MNSKSASKKKMVKKIALVLSIGLCFLGVANNLLTFPEILKR